MNQRFQKLLRSFSRKAVVLMYHRVASPVGDPWNLCVSAKNFDRQIRYLAKNYNPVSVEELTRQLAAKKIKPNTVCITFDDGYLDNYVYAKPVLEKYNCPACFFISTRFIAEQTAYWWDELESIICLSAQLPPVFDVSINKQPNCFALEKDRMLSAEALAAYQTWRWDQAAPTKRCELYLRIWAQLKPLTFDQIQSHLNQIRQWAQRPETVDTTRQPMSFEAVRQVSRNPLFEIGLHTHTHSPLPARPAIEIETEIRSCSDYLTRHGISFINSISYPYGDYSGECFPALSNNGLQTAFTTAARLINQHSDVYTLGRFQVCNWATPEFDFFLNNAFGQRM